MILFLFFHVSFYSHFFNFLLFIFRLTLGMKKIQEETTVPDLIVSSGYKVHFHEQSTKL